MGRSVAAATVALSIDVIHGGKTIGRVVVDKGASTCIMSLSRWKALGSPELVPSNTLRTAFDGRSFRPHGILPTFEIKLAGKTVSVEVEVIDAPLDYNLLLGKNWTYAMSAIASAVFRVVVFPHEGKFSTRVLLHVLCPFLVGKLLDPQSWSHQTPYLLLLTEGHSICMVSYRLLKLRWQSGVY